MPRRGRRSNRRIVSLQRRRRRSRAQGRGLLRGLCVAGLLYVVAINGAVRSFGGGAPSVLSVSYLGHKSRAVANLGLHALRHVFTDPHPPLSPVLHEVCVREGVPYDLAFAIARAESSLDPHSISATGAMGLMQLMPPTAAELGVADPFDSADSARGGVAYLARLWRRYGGDRARVAAAYNAGPARVPRRGRVRGLPAETRAYVQKVLGRSGEVWVASQ